MSRFFCKTAKLEPYVPGEQPVNRGDYIKLNTNESPFPPSPIAVEAGKAAIGGLNLYSEPDSSELCAAIAQSLRVDVDNVCVYNGSDEALAFLFTGFCGKGAVINDVTYGFYKVAARLAGVKTSVVALRNDYSIDVSDYEGVTGTVFIANPNAPTGIALPLDDIVRLASQDEDRLIVVDEAYVDFGAQSAAELVNKFGNIAVVRTFSKSRSLAGGRLGFTVADKSLTADIQRVRNSFNPYNVGSVTQAMGAAAVRDTDYFERTLKVIIENRSVMTSGLRKLGFRVLKSSANFVFASPPDRDGGRLYRELKQRGVLVRYWDENRVREFCRITVGSADDVNALLLRTAEIYGKQGR